MRTDFRAAFLSDEDEKMQEAFVAFKSFRQNQAEKMPERWRGDLSGDTHLRKEKHDVPYLPAQEASAQERAWLPQENGDRQRPQGSGPPQSEGQKKAELLIQPDQTVSRAAD